MRIVSISFPIDNFNLSIKDSDINTELMYRKLNIRVWRATHWHVSDIKGKLVELTKWIARTRQKLRNTPTGVS